ncbi:hypothetical protein BYT27DRAFT_7251286 [Phlegmacium glaucopus]|nr:hypothetical protein BYT27DRAFT_7251286 [Phlegmacium glaucopus]
MSESNKGNRGGTRMAHVESDSEKSDPQSVDTMLDIHSISDSEEWDSEEGGPESAIYQVSELTPLSTFPQWDEINASLNIRLIGPKSLKGLCDEAHFARSHLTMTSSALINGSTQAKAALFCVEQICAGGIAEDLRTAFAKLLPRSLLHAEKLLTLTLAIQSLKTDDALYQSLPSDTQKAITDYLGQHPPSTVTKSSTHAMTNQKPSTTLSSSTAHRTAHKLSPTPQPLSGAGSGCATPSQTRLVLRTSRVLSHSAQTQPSPGASQNASSASRAPQYAQDRPFPPHSESELPIDHPDYSPIFHCTPQHLFADARPKRKKHVTSKQDTPSHSPVEVAFWSIKRAGQHLPSLNTDEGNLDEIRPLKLDFGPGKTAGTQTLDQELRLAEEPVSL